MTVIAENIVPVEVVPYNPVWKAEFSRIKDRMLEIAGDLILGAEHVGSTSIEGLSSKPIIDLDLVIESYEVLPVIIARFREYGYVHLGNLGIEGREVFKSLKDDGLMQYHHYVCPKDGKGYLEHIAFRDYLCNHPAEVRAYEEIKLGLAVQFRNDREAYTEGKTAFVRSILTKAMHNVE